MIDTLEYQVLYSNILSLYQFITVWKRVRKNGGFSEVNLSDTVNNKHVFLSENFENKSMK